MQEAREQAIWPAWQRLHSVSAYRAMVSKQEETGGGCRASITLSVYTVANLLLDERLTAP